jgi:hypothetical protein
MKVDEIDDALEESEYIRLAMEHDLPRIPRTPTEVVDDIFAGRLSINGKGDAYCATFEDPASYHGEVEFGEYERILTEEQAERLIEAAGEAYRRRNEPIQEQGGVRDENIGRRNRNNIQVNPRRFGAVRPPDARINPYLDEIARLRGRMSARNGRVRSARFGMEEVNEAMRMLPEANPVSAARFLRTWATQEAQREWLSGRITQQDYQDAIEQVIESHNAVIASLAEERRSGE